MAAASSRRWSSVEERPACSTLSSLRALGSVKLIAIMRSRAMPLDSIRHKVVIQSASYSPLPWTNRIGGTSPDAAGEGWANAPVRKLAIAKGKLPAPSMIIRRDSFICSSPAKPSLCTAYTGLTTGQRRTFAGITELAGIAQRPLQDDFKTTSASPFGRGYDRADEPPENCGRRHHGAAAVHRVPAHLARQPALQSRPADPRRGRRLGHDADGGLGGQGGAGADRSDAADYADLDASRRHRRHV